MIEEEKIDAVWRAIQCHTTMPRRFIVGSNRPSSCHNRTLAAVLLREVLGLGVEQIAEELELQSHSSVVEMLNTGRHTKGTAAEIERLAADVRRRIEPHDFNPDDAET